MPRGATGKRQSTENDTGAGPPRPSPLLFRQAIRTSYQMSNRRCRWPSNRPHVKQTNLAVLRSTQSRKAKAQNSQSMPSIDASSLAFVVCRGTPELARGEKRANGDVPL